MNRERVRNEMSSRNWVASGGGGNSTFLPFVGSDPFVCPYYRTESTFSDSTTPSGSPQIVNPCVHVKRRAAVGIDSITIGFSSSVPNLTLRPADHFLRIYEPSTTFSPPWASLVEQLVAQLSGNVDEGTLLGVSLAELPKTIAMFRNPFNLLRTDWRQIAKKLSCKELVKGSANVWLEKTYGWGAFYQDIKSFAKTWSRVMTPSVADSLLRQAQRYASRQTSTLTSPTTTYLTSSSNWNSWLSTYPMSNNGYGYNYRIRDMGTVAHTAISCLQIFEQLNSLASLHQKLLAFGLSPMSILATLWEMVPYSFVVDWFINTRIAALPIQLARLEQADIRNLCYSVKRVHTYEVDFSPSGYAMYYYGGSWIYQTPQTSDVKYIVCKGGSNVNYQRSVGLPSIDWLASFLGRGLSVRQGISGVSLILQRLLK